ncbi:archaellin/type IV pilin N-terminal domain-containing protein [Methanocella sp. MCL-LM]|uniref:archaellin/type IV pilin N-terminal domain-containing protein n=1 Tax=Methanocella sp. MCL-LM TaxID=3412035 RepID=UPI003C70C2CE
MKSNRKFTKNSAAFTGLEAAIVLIAFVVVAAVFSYVMLGAGFFTSQKSKEVVHTGVDQATSSIELAGDIIGGSSGGTVVEYIDVTLSLTAGNNPVDLEKLVVSYNSEDDYKSAIWGDGNSAHYDYAAVYPTWEGATDAKDTAADTPMVPGTGYMYYWVQSNQVTPNNLLEQFEKVTIHICLTNDDNLGLTGELTHQPGTNYDINLEIKPASGATLMIPLKTPPVIKTIMRLG